MQKRVFLLSALLILAVAGGLATDYLFFHPSLLAGGVRKFGLLKLGGEIPIRAGDGTVWAPPYEKVPPSKFFVYILKEDFSCVWESCGLDGAVVRTLGGYLAGKSFGEPEVVSEFGFDDVSIREKYKSVVIIADRDSKIVGIYPNRDLTDVLNILRLHPPFADFSMLNGVSGYGSLKIGQLAPVRPYGQAPKETKFYLYVFDKKILGQGPCVSVACLGPGYFDYADEFGGWFSSDGELATAAAFGVDTDKLLRAETSLVVIADKNFKIVAIHPNKKASDILTILSFHPELADLSGY
ncbi:MAG: hypothetical protein Q7R92_01840 [bacterium]|nr:hypothetical protein [bacterium]